MAAELCVSGNHVGQAQTSQRCFINWALTGSVLAGLNTGKHEPIGT